MPVLAEVGSPYPTVASIMDLARVRVNDTAFGLAGDLLANTQPYALTILNAAWRWLQRKAANVGIETYLQEVFLTGLPAAANPTDLTSQCFVSALGCGDGVNQYAAPALPLDMVLPLSVWIRQSGTSNAFMPMRQAENGLPTILDHGVYDDRTDGLYFYGNTYPVDMRIRYSAGRADLSFTDPNMLVPMMYCQDCLSARVAYEFCQRTGAAAAAEMMQLAETAFATMSLSTGRRKQRMSIRRQPYSARSGGFVPRWPVSGF